MSQTDAPILILTATIAPPADATNLSRTDPAARLNDYASALRYYAACLERAVISGIVFAENSLADISVLRQLAAQSSRPERIEFIQFAGLDHPGRCGRGYGEFKLLDHAMRESALINDAPPDAEVWKITGRYEVLNLAPILARRSPECDLWAHCRNLPRRWADMYLLGWRREFYHRHLEGIYRELDQSASAASAEQMFRDKVDTLALKQRVCRRFAEPPDLRGIRGLDGAAYSDQRLKQLVRRVCDNLFPWVWI
jgi:hypothetical protein